MDPDFFIGRDISWENDQSKSLRPDSKFSKFEIDTGFIFRKFLLNVSLGQIFGKRIHGKKF